MDTRVDWWRAEATENDWWAANRARAGEWLPPRTAVPFWATVGFTVVLLFSPQAYFPWLGALRPAFLLAGIGILFYGYDRWIHRQPLIVWNREMRLVAGLLVWAAATIPLSIWPGGSVNVLFDQYLKTVAMFWLLGHVLVTTDRLRQIAWALTLMAIALSGFAVYNYVTGAFALGGASDRVMGNEGSLTKNPNDMALMINLVIPLTIGLFVSSKDLWLRGVLLAAIACEATTVVLTYSRAGALTLGVIFALYLWKLRRRPERRLLYAVLVAALLALPLLPSTYFDRLSTITSIESDRTGSSQERWADMTIALQTFLSNPLKGSGLGMNVLTMNQARGDWRAVHNVYLEHALDLGLPGLILFVLLLSACLQAAVLAQRRSEAGGQPRLFHMAEAVQVSLIAYGVAAMFHPVSYQFYFYYIASLAVAARQLSMAQETAHA